MRTVPILLIFIFFVSYSCKKSSDYQHQALVKFEAINFEDALVLAAQQGKKVMIDFWSYG